MMLQSNEENEGKKKVKEYVPGKIRTNKNRAKRQRKEKIYKKRKKKKKGAKRERS